MSAAVLAIVLTLLSITALIRAFGNAGRPATEPTPVDTGIFSGLGGWIAYGNGYFYGNFNGTTGIWAMDPERRGVQKQLSTRSGETRVVQRRNEAADPQTNRARLHERPSLYVLNGRLRDPSDRCALQLLPVGGSFTRRVEGRLRERRLRRGQVWDLCDQAAGGTPRLPNPGGPYDAVLSPMGLRSRT
jgi:hypothetical protein